MEYFRFLAIIPCFTVMGIVICRLDLMNIKAGARRAWAFKYILTAGYAFGQAIDVYVDNIGWFDYLGVLAFLLYLLHSRHRWSSELPPPESTRAAVLDINVDSSYP